MKQVRIVRKIVRRVDGVSERERTVLDGMRHDRDEKIYLQFKEMLAEDTEPIATLMTVDDRGVKLHRKGNVGGDMYFVVGMRTGVRYQTPMGVLDMEIDTRRADVFVSEDALEIELSYNLLSEGELLSEIEMDIRAE